MLFNYNRGMSGVLSFKDIPSAKFNKNKGFSLIELVIVIAIMAVLVGLIAPAFNKYIRSNREKACKQNREALLAIYERAVFDSSTSIDLSDKAKLAKFIPISDLSDSDSSIDGGTLYKPVRVELHNYAVCPLHKNTGTYNEYGVDKETGTAWIKCSDCENIVSVDLTGWSTQAATTGDNDTSIPTPAPTATPEKVNEYTVNFNLNGHGSPQPDSQTIKEGGTVTKPANPADKLYDFVGWYLGSNEYNFSTKVTSDLTLTAKWQGTNYGSIFPYADDDSWWDATRIATEHAGEYVESGTSLTDTTTNNICITIKAPSGIFTSKSGGQFVFVMDTKIYYHEATSPEYYAAAIASANRELIQLTGQTYTYDLSGLDANGSITTDTLTIGDLVVFTYNGTSYTYVVWHDNESFTVSPSELTNYPEKLKNWHRVSTEY